MRAANLPIGELSRKSGVNIETIRYYERIRLMPPPPRTKGRHRAYASDHVTRLIFIRRARELGFSLEDIRRLLALAGHGAAACAEAKELTNRHLADVRGKISSLKSLERALQDMTSACRPGRQDACPILDALAIGG